MDLLNIHKDQTTNKEIEKFTEKYKEYLDYDLINNPEKFNDLILLFNKTNANDLIRYFFKHYIVGEPDETVKRELVKGISLMINHRVEQAKIAMLDLIKKIKNEMPDQELLALREVLKIQILHLEKYGIDVGVYYDNYLDKFYHLSLNYPDDLLKHFSNIPVLNDMNFSEYVNKHAKIPKNIGELEKRTNHNLRQVVRDLRNRVVEMYQWNLSYNKIQKTLTQECIDQGRIPAQVTRLSRAQQSIGVIIQADTLLPISEIKKVILESQSA